MESDEIKKLREEVDEIKKDYIYRNKELQIEIDKLKTIKDVIRKDVKKFIRENIGELIEGEFITKEQADVILNAKQLKAEIRKIIEYEIATVFQEILPHNQEFINTLVNKISRAQLYSTPLPEVLKKMAQDELRVLVKDDTLHKHTENLIKQYLENNVDEIVELIITRSIENLNKKLNKEYEITKKLTYSIEAEVKHTLMRLPISLETERVIREKIEQVFKKQPKIRMLEDINKEEV